jgi:anaerobic selenocysteine-containing dehydrogenase
MICHCLNGITGACDSVGGTLVNNKEYTVGFPKWDDFLDEAAKKGSKMAKIDHRGRKDFPCITSGRPGSSVVTNRAADGILNADPYDIKVAIAYMNNFNFSCTQPERWNQALSKIPFLVHITTNASEFSWFSDILLPDTHHLFEKWGWVKSAANGYRHVTLQQPVIKPMWEAKIDETEIPYLVAEKLAQRGFDNMLNYFKTIKDPETGKEPANEKEFALYCVKLTTQALWDPAKYQGGDKFNGWEEFRKAGVWNSAPYPFRKRWSAMNTKTKKFEFYSETLKDALEEHAKKHNTTVDDILEVSGYQAKGELAFVPHYEEPSTLGDEKEYPFLFVDHKSRLNREGRSANCTWYQEFKDVDPGDAAWDDVAKINPVDAKKLGLRNGDKIRITSPTGKLECTAKLWEGAQPGTVAKCYGQGHWVYGRVAAKVFGKEPRGGNNNEVLPAVYDRFTGSTVRHAATRVKIEKI